MITDKNEAIVEVGKDNPNFKNIDPYLLTDKDVAKRYMEKHSSNSVLVSKFPINIDVNGLIDDEEFIISVINNLSTGYDYDSLTSLLKYSTNRIVTAKVESGEELDDDCLKQVITDILTRYDNAFKVRKEHLSKIEQTLGGLEKFINDSNILDSGYDSKPNGNNKSKRKSDRYKDTSIGFTAQF